jgi:hypothetical protein
MFLLLDAVDVVKPVLERAGLRGDLAEAVMTLRSGANRAVAYSPDACRPRWSKREGIAAKLVLDALIKTAEAYKSAGVIAEGVDTAQAIRDADANEMW